MTFSQPTRRLVFGSGLVLAIALAAAPVLAADHAVSIVDRKFEPAQVTIAVGDTVTWTVTKAIGEPHSVRSGKVTDPDVGMRFDSGVDGLKDNGQTFEHAFAEAGTYDYYCQVHPVEMTGQVIVTGPGESAPAAGPPSEAEAGIPVERRLLGAGILAITLVLCFAGAWAWRRVNPA
jgi:plastocyanin